MFEPLKFYCITVLGFPWLQGSVVPYFCSSLTSEQLVVVIYDLQDLGRGQVVRWCWVNYQCRGVLLVSIGVGQGPTALAVGAGGRLFGQFFSRLSFLFAGPRSAIGRAPDS